MSDGPIKGDWRASILRGGIWFVLLAALGHAVLTQWVAYEFDYALVLGRPILEIPILIPGGIKIYVPIGFTVWYWTFTPDHPLSTGLFYFKYWNILTATIIICNGLRKRIGSNKSSSAHGTAEWGNPDDKKYGLKQRCGVVVGASPKGKFIVDNRNTHMIIAAPTGSGKTAGPAILTLLSYRESIVVADVKGELFNYTSGWRDRFSEICNFNPLAKVPTTRINPLLEVRPGVDAVADCGIIASALCPTEKGKEEDHWVLKAREWVTGALLYMLFCEDRRNLHLGYLYELTQGYSLESKNYFGLLMKAARVNDPEDPEAKELEAYIRYTGSGIANTPEREAGSILSTISSHLNIFRNPRVIASMRDSTMSLKSLAYGPRPVTLYITVPPNEVGILGPVIRLLFEMTCGVLIDSEPERADTGTTFDTFRKQYRKIFPKKKKVDLCKTWPPLKNRHNVMLLIDEAPRYGRLEAIEGSVGLLRSYGVRVVLITQALQVLKKIYGDDSQIFYNAGVKLFLGANENSEAEMISKLVGVSTAGYQSRSFTKDARETTTGSSSSSTRFQRNLINADEVLRINETEGKETGILIVEGVRPMKVERTYYFNYPSLLEKTKMTPKDLSIGIPIKNYWTEYGSPALADQIKKWSKPAPRAPGNGSADKKKEGTSAFSTAVENEKINKSLGDKDYPAEKKAAQKKGASEGSPNQTGGGKPAAPAAGSPYENLMKGIKALTDEK